MTPLATSYSTTPFSLSPQTTSTSLTYHLIRPIFSLSDGVLRRPVELAGAKAVHWCLSQDGADGRKPFALKDIQFGEKKIAFQHVHRSRELLSWLMISINQHVLHHMTRKSAWFSRAAAHSEAIGRVCTRRWRPRSIHPTGWQESPLVPSMPQLSRATRRSTACSACAVSGMT